MSTTTDKRRGAQQASRLHGQDASTTTVGSEGQVAQVHEGAGFAAEFETLAMRMATASCWWSEPGWYALRDGDSRSVLFTYRGTIRCFDRATGAPVEMTADLEMRIVAEAIPEAKAMLSDSEPDRRARGATLLGLLGARESVPVLKRVLQEAVPARRSSHGLARARALQRLKLAAAEALVRLIGAAALPLIERQLPGASPMVKNQLLRIMSGTGILDTDRADLARFPAAREVWRRLLHDPCREVRACALAQLIRGGDSQYLRIHPGLLHGDRATSNAPHSSFS